jgi:hypothetical protein
MYRSIFGVLVVVASLAVAQEKPNVSFEWSFATLSTAEKESLPVPIVRDTALQTGDPLKMMVRLKTDCFVYVMHENPAGEISLKFPYDLKQFTTDYKIGKNYYIPKGREWFKLDKVTGRETFYIIASGRRLLDLEVLLSKYKEADASKKPAVAKDIVAEIRNVRKYYKTFTTLAERPISIGGNVRGMGKESSGGFPDVALIATEISANNFYGKTFTIDHK